MDRIAIDAVGLVILKKLGNNDAVIGKETLNRRRYHGLLKSVSASAGLRIVNVSLMTLRAGPLQKN